MGYNVSCIWGQFHCVNSLRPSDASVRHSIIGSDNGLSPGRRQAIIWTNDGILLIGPLGTNFSEIFIEILTLSLKKMHLKVSSAKWRPFYLGLNVRSDTYMSPVTHICASEQHWFRHCYLFGANPLLDQFWLIFKLTLKDNLQWNLGHN